MKKYFATSNALASGCDSASGLSLQPNSAMDELLFEIYDRWCNHKYRYSSVDSDTITEQSMSETGIRRQDNAYSTCSDADNRHVRRYNETSIKNYDVKQLQEVIKVLQHRTSIVSSRLVRQLKRRDHRLVRLQKNCDVLTAVLQAASLKRRQDTKLKFTIEPKPGPEAFRHWKDAMKGVARLPPGIPPEFRRKVWRALAEEHIQSQKLDWEQTRRFVFNERSNPDDDSLGMQIVKDLHRTGCDRFCSEADRAVLKRVLLAYARWNKKVGYCQGFNVLAALILEVTERCEEDALRIMLYLVDHILPESYFSQNLQALSVDMAVFRDLMRLYLPDLAEHLEKLQRKAAAGPDGNPLTGYEPPLTNVFTMQWFLTLFATCLSPNSVLRVWDAVLLEGSEVMLRVALTIWEKLTDRIKKIDSADQFYSLMSSLTQDMAEDGIIETEELMQRVYSMAPFPFPNLAELREKYTYNITPFHTQLPADYLHSPAAANRRPGMMRAAGAAAEEDVDEEEAALGSISCFTGLWHQSSQLQHSGPAANAGDISQVGPGAVSSEPSGQHPTLPTAYRERMNTNLSALQAQYFRLKHKQRQAALVMPVSNAPKATPAAAGAGGAAGAASSTSALNNGAPSPSVMQPSTMVNHLFLGHERLGQQPKKASFGGSTTSSVAPPSTVSSSRRPSSVIVSCSSTPVPSISEPSKVSPGRPRNFSNLSSPVAPPSPMSQPSPVSPASLSPSNSKDSSKSQASTLLQLASQRQRADSAESLTVALVRHNRRQEEDMDRWVCATLSQARGDANTSVEQDSDDEEDSDGETLSESSLTTTASHCWSRSSAGGAMNFMTPFTRRALRSRINFGSQFGLYKAMTQNATVRSNVNACLRRSYLDHFQTAVGSQSGSRPAEVTGPSSH